MYAHDSIPGADATRLTAKDLRVLALWVLAGLLGAGVAFHHFFQAFPEAAVDFRVSRSEAVERARKFVNAQGHLVGDYESTIIFRVDANNRERQDEGKPEYAKLYLERELGLEEANRLTAGEVNLWSWHVRFFRPQQQEEFLVQISPAGGVVGYWRVLPEAQKGERLELEAARVRAESFLREQVQIELHGYDYLPAEANSTERPNRRDWSFTWERRGFRAKDAPYHLRVRLQGDQPGGYEEFLKVPEAWERDFQNLRADNTFFQVAAQVPYAFLLGAVFLMLYDLGRRGLVKWRGALQLGLVLAALFFVMQLNEWPLSRHGYDTNSSYSGFFVLQVVLALAIGVGASLMVTLPVAAGEPLYRGDHPSLLRLGAAFSWRTWRDGLCTKEFFRATVIGLAMAAAHIGFVVAFYLLGRNFGVWAPQEINYTDAVNTALPWIYPLTISLFAATSEEFLFRLFAIPLLLRVTKSKLVAIVLPALVWGFLHSAYPQQPGWVRGVEVGIIGVVAGWVMLRWGILATLVWHYTVDALLIGLFLLRSENLYFLVSGSVVVALTLFPLLFATGAYLVRRRFSADESLLNQSEPLLAEAPAKPGAEATPVPTEQAVAAAAPGAAYQPASTGVLAFVLGLGALGVAATVLVQPERIGDFVRFSLNARQAEARADEILRQRGVDPARFRRATMVADTLSGVKSEYLRRQVGLAEANRLYRERVPSVFWRVRYFRSGEKEEYHVILHPDGQLHAVRHELDEAAPGATLTKEEAQARAEAWLREEGKLDLAQWKLVEAESKKEKNRTDHTFTWEEILPIGSSTPAREQTGGPEESAHVRIELKVLGDQVSGYRIFVKIPEKWEREQTELTLPRIVHLVFRILFYLACGITVLVIFFRNLKQQRVPWARFSRWALWGAAAVVLAFVAGFSKFIALAYSTEMGYEKFLAILVIGLFFGVMLIYSGIFLLFGLSWFFLARVFGEQRMPSWRGMPRGYYRDALLLALGGAGALMLLKRAGWLVDQAWPTAQRALGSAVPQNFDSLLPAASVISGATQGGLLATGLVALAAGVLAWLGRAVPERAHARLAQAGFFVFLAVVLPGGWGSPADFAKNVLVDLAVLGMCWASVVHVFRFNLLAYFLFVVVASLAGEAMELLRQPEAFLQMNGYLALAAGMAFLAWPLWGWLRGKDAQPPGALAGVPQSNH